MIPDTLRGRLWKVAIGATEGRLERLEELHEWETYDRRQLRRRQRAWLQSHLEHCYENVPYYRETFEQAGIVEDGTPDVDQFTDIPLLDKETLRERGEQLCSLDLESRSWYENTSGGSTGEPVQFVQDATYRDWNLAVTTLFNEWAGYGPGEPRIKLWGSERDLEETSRSLRSKVGSWLRNQTLLNAYRMTEDDMRRYVEIINQREPALIVAYVESIYELASYVGERNVDVHSPRSIITTAGTLYPEMRERIEETFGTEVFNRYGSREIGDVACECSRHEGLHVSPTQYVEVVREDGTLAEPGERGEIVVTTLTNEAMPLIRYRIGDVGTLAANECPCGRAWQHLESVEGRVSDLFVTEDGTKTHGAYFRHLLFGCEWIDRYQIVQEDYDHVRFLLEVESRDDEPGDESELDEIRTGVQTVMGSECEVSFEFTDEIPPTPSGKYRYTRSKVYDRQG